MADESSFAFETIHRTWPEECRKAEQPEPDAPCQQDPSCEDTGNKYTIRLAIDYKERYSTWQNTDIKNTLCQNSRYECTGLSKSVGQRAISWAAVPQYV